VDHADQRRRAAEQSERHREGRQLVDEVERAVERVEEPAQVVLAARRVLRLLLGLDRVLGEGAAQALDDRALGLDVGRGDQVARDALRADLRRSQAAEVLHQHGAGGERGLFGDGEEAAQLAVAHGLASTSRTQSSSCIFFQHSRLSPSTSG
jgi:hypothetical protein